MLAIPNMAQTNVDHVDRDVPLPAKLKFRSKNIFLHQ